MRQLGESLFEVGLGGSSSPAASAGAPRGATGARCTGSGGLEALSAVGGGVRRHCVLLDLLGLSVGGRGVGLGRAARERGVPLALHQKVVVLNIEAAFL